MKITARYFERYLIEWKCIQVNMDVLISKNNIDWSHIWVPVKVEWEHYKSKRFMGFTKRRIFKELKRAIVKRECKFHKPFPFDQKFEIQINGTLIKFDPISDEKREDQKHQYITMEV